MRINKLDLDLESIETLDDAKIIIQPLLNLINQNSQSQQSPAVFYRSRLSQRSNGPRSVALPSHGRPGANNSSRLPDSINAIFRFNIYYE